MFVLDRNFSYLPVKRIKRNLPFPRMPSLLISAIVLSFYGFDNEVEKLLNMLSKVSSLYLKRHKLKGFLVREPRKLTWLVNFQKSVLQ